MQIVIDISEEEYEKNKKNRCDYHTLCMAIKKGTPLPEYHGRLIDADAIQKHQVDTYGQGLRIIDDAPTILEGE